MRNNVIEIALLQADEAEVPLNGQENLEHIQSRGGLMRRLKLYKITPEDYAQLVSKQGGACAICAQEPGQKGFHIDHCHTTGEVRGLLCGRCNMGLGQFKDSITSLRHAIKYLRGFESPQDE